MIAYDALLGAGDNWTELCQRAMCHGGEIAFFDVRPAPPSHPEAPAQDVRILTPQDVGPSLGVVLPLVAVPD